MSRTVKSLAVKKAAPKTGAALSVVALAVAIVLGNGVEKGFAQPAPRGGALATRPAETGLARPGAPGTVEAPRAGRATEARRAGAVDALSSRGAVAPGVTAASTAGQRAAVAPVTTLRVRPANDNAAPPVVASPLNGAVARLRALDTPANDDAVPVAGGRPARAYQGGAARPSGAVATTNPATPARSAAETVDRALAALTPADLAEPEVRDAVALLRAVTPGGRSLVKTCALGELSRGATRNLALSAAAAAQAIQEGRGDTRIAARRAFDGALSRLTRVDLKTAGRNRKILCVKCDTLDQPTFCQSVAVR